MWGCCARMTGQQSSEEIMPKLFIGNVPYSVSDDDLHEWIESRGFPLESVHILTYRDCRTVPGLRFRATGRRIPAARGDRRPARGGAGRPRASGQRGQAGLQGPFGRQGLRSQPTIRDRVQFSAFLQPQKSDHYLLTEPRVHSDGKPVALWTVRSLRNEKKAADRKGAMP